MKILTFVKHVPTSAVTPRISDGHDRIEEDGLAYEVNEADLYAIEEALHQRSAHGGSVISATVGPARAKQALHVAFAMGVDQAVHVIDETARGTNALLTVGAAAAVARKLGPDLIFAGIQAEDDLLGQFGVALAEELDLPVVTAVTEIHVEPQGRVAKVVRELGGGFKQQLEVDLPCVLTIQFGIRQLRYTPIMSIVRARSRPIQSIEIDAVRIASERRRTDSQLRVLTLSYPEDGGHCEMIDGSPAQVAGKLVEKLVKVGVV